MIWAIIVLVISISLLIVIFYQVNKPIGGGRHKVTEVVNDKEIQDTGDSFIYKLYSDRVKQNVIPLEPLDIVWINNYEINNQIKNSILSAEQKRTV